MHLSPVICGSHPLNRSILWWYTISVGVTFASDLRFPSRAIDTGDAHARYAMMTVIEQWRAYPDKISGQAKALPSPTRSRTSRSDGSDSLSSSDTQNLDTQGREAADVGCDRLSPRPLLDGQHSQ